MPEFHIISTQFNIVKEKVTNKNTKSSSQTLTQHGPREDPAQKTHPFRRVPPETAPGNTNNLDCCLKQTKKKPHKAL